LAAALRHAQFVDKNQQAKEKTRAMNSNPQTPPPRSQSAPRSRTGLAVASLVLGILAFLSGIFVVGAVFGIIGLILGVVHLFRRNAGRRGLAGLGVLLSVIGIAASVAVVVVLRPYLPKAWQEFREAMAAAQPGGGDSTFDQWQGVLAPNFSVTTLDRETIQLSELKGKRVVLDFWATWCPPCRKEIPHFVQLRKETSADQLVIIGISSEDADTLKSFVKKNGINYPIASADDFPSPYKDVTGIPTTFFIDRNGVIQDVLVGYHDFGALKTHALAADAVSEPKPAPNATGKTTPKDSTAL
jgi:peroxiredoxin